MRKELGIMIKNQRQKRELKQADVARKLKISVSYIQQLEYEGLGAVFSETLMLRVVKFLRLPRDKVLALTRAHNRRAARYRRDWAA